MNENVASKRKIFSRFNLKITLSIIAVLVFISIISVNLITVDKVIIEPGTAETVGQAIEFKNVKTYDADGKIRFLTVYVSAKKPSLAEYLKARYLDGNDVEIFTWEQVNGNQTAKQSEQLNEALMAASQSSATVVALNELGCKVNETGTGAMVTAVEKNSPADKKLMAGDVIIAIGSEPARIARDTGDLIRSHQPGDMVQVEIERGKNNVKKTFEIKLAQSPFEKGTAFLGVGLVTRDQDFNFPVDVQIDPGAVSGPSAGLAFTLSIIDQLTPGDLTGGHDVAVTGEITLDGDVNQVGGIKGKSLTARRAGADVLIVPKGEAKLARKNAGSMKVYEVSSISQALKVLERIGGDPLSRMRRCPSS